MKNFISTIIGFSFLLCVLIAMFSLVVLFDQQMRVAFAKSPNKPVQEQNEPIVREHSEEKAVEYEEVIKYYCVIKFYVQFDIKFVDVRDELGEYSTLTFVNHNFCQRDPHLMAAEVEEDKYYKITTIMDKSINERDRIIVNLESCD